MHTHLSFEIHTKTGGQNMEIRDVSQFLYDKDPEYRSLYDQHRSLETRLTELSSRIYLSDTERVEEITLKKKKLALKDRMQELVKKHSA